MRCPSILHGHLYMEQYQEAYPQAALFKVPGLDRKRPDLRFDRELTGSPEPEWSQDLDQKRFEGHRVAGRVLNEVEFFHRKTRSLITGDLCFNIGSEWPLLDEGADRGPPAQGRWGRADNRLVRRALLMIAAVFALAPPASAETVTFGANLGAHVSNSNVICGDFNIFQYAGRVGCSVYTTGNASNPADTSATHVIPFPDPRVHGDQHGTITQVTFKPSLGAPVGPARLSVVEYIRDANSTADPGLAQDIADSANFIMAPGADGLVHVATDLPARSLYNANDNSYRFDALVLSMLDNTTPIPADLSSQFLSAWISPYVDIPSTQGDLTVPLPADRQGTGCCGFGPNPFYALGAWYTLGEVLMQAELTLHQPPPVTNPVKIGQPRLRRNTVILPVECALDRACRGLLQLLSGGNGASASKSGKSKKTIVYGRVRFSVPAHAKKRLKVKLNKAGKKLLKRSRRMRKPVRMVARATVGSQVTATTIKLTSGRRK